VTTLELLYSSDVTSADFYLFPRLKSALKGRVFPDVTYELEELKKLSQNGFQECFQHLYSRWQKCIAEQREYYEGNVA
jgi:hypothetical protein